MSISARRETEEPAQIAGVGSQGRFGRWRLTSPVDRCLLAAIVLGAAYWSLCLAATVFERSLTYHTAADRPRPSAVGLAGVSEWIISTPDRQRLVVWHAEARPGMPTILYFHGNGDTLAYRAGRVAAFQALGYGVFMMAYRGYSGSTGRPSETAILADARLAYDTLARERIAASDIVIYGESLGTSVAIRTALDRPAAAVILEAPFTSMVDAWRQFAPLLPLHLLLTDRFDTRSVIGRLSPPLLVLHGRRDGMVGFALGEALFAEVRGPKRFAEFPEAGHSDLYAFGAIKSVHRFIDDVRAGRPIGP